MVIAVEPKAFLPKHGMVGIENTFLLTGDGLRLLTLAPEEFGIVYCPTDEFLSFLTQRPRGHRDEPFCLSEDTDKQKGFIAETLIRIDRVYPSWAWCISW
jgi:hypothetical protein